MSDENQGCTRDVGDEKPLVCEKCIEYARHIESPDKICNTNVSLNTSPSRQISSKLTSTTHTVTHLLNKSKLQS